MHRRKVLKVFGVLGGVSLLSGSAYLTFFNVDEPVKNYFSDHKDLLAELVECIIPETDTPGAKRANVHLFVIGLLENCSTKKEKSNFYNGLENMQSYCTLKYGTDFMNCTADQRIDAMTYFEGKGELGIGIIGKVRKKILGEPFFGLLKRYTIQGYCNSRLGATQNFRYDRIPVHYEPCIDYIPEQSSWSTK